MELTAVLALIGACVLIANFVALVWKGAAWMRDFYLATVGERRYLYRKLRRLTPGVQIDRFTEYLGAPIFKNPRDTQDDVIYAHRYYYVQAVVNKEGKVLMYAVTSRSPRFKPPIWPHNLKLPTYPMPPNNRLGTFAFDDLPFSPSNIMGSLGARRYHYMEAYYFGNPAHYQHWTLAINDAAQAEAPLGSLEGVMQGYDLTLSDDDPHALQDYLDRRDVQEFRSKARPNTYGVTAPHVSPALYIGPDQDQVRTLNE